MQLPESDYTTCPKHAVLDTRHEVLDLDVAVRRCVANDHLAGGGSCGCAVPAAVVLAAWARAQRRSGRFARFFRFSWKGELWLSFGLEHGGVRGVYCPEHTAERDGRAYTRARRPRLEFPLAG